MRLKLLKYLRAFTLSELMIALAVLSIVVAATIKVTKVQTTYINKYMYYAAFMNLKQGVGEVLAQGCTAADVTNGDCTTVKALPQKGYDSSYTTRGLCYRLSQIFNTVGAVDCTKTATSGFASATPNFILSNGAKFFNLGTTAASSSYTVYIDFDGSRGSSVLNTDVMAFIVNTDGTVYPEPSSTGATNSGYLAASVRYRSATSPFPYVWLYKGISYYYATCYAEGTYNGTTCTTPTQASACTTNTCQVAIIKPSF